MKQVCEHGQLARQCVVCELVQENTTLKEHLKVVYAEANNRTDELQRVAKMIGLLPELWFPSAVEDRIAVLLDIERRMKLAVVRGGRSG